MRTPVRRNSIPQGDSPPSDQNTWVLAICGVLCLCAVMFLSACVTFSVPDTEGDDRGALLPTARVTIQVFPRDRENSITSLLSRRQARSERGQDPTESTGFEKRPKSARAVRGTLSVDFEYSYGKGDFGTQLGGGPADAEFSMHNFTPSARGGMLLYERLRLEGLLGLHFHFAELDLEPLSGAPRDENIQFGILPMLGAKVTLDVSRHLDLHGQATLGFGTNVFSFFMKLSSVEAGAVIELVPGVSVIGGWRWWELETDDVDIDLSGPVVGLLLTF